MGQGLVPAHPAPVARGQRTHYGADILVWPRRLSPISTSAPGLSRPDSRRAPPPVKPLCLSARPTRRTDGELFQQRDRPRPGRRRLQAASRALRRVRSPGRPVARPDRFFDLPMSPLARGWQTRRRCAPVPTGWRLPLLRSGLPRTGGAQRPPQRPAADHQQRQLVRQVDRPLQHLQMAQMRAWKTAATCFAAPTTAYRPSLITAAGSSPALISSWKQP